MVYNDEDFSILRCEGVGLFWVFFLSFFSPLFRGCIYANDVELQLKLQVVNEQVHPSTSPTQQDGQKKAQL